MKKWLIGSALVVSMLLSVSVFAAGVVETEYGYIVTGLVGPVAIRPDGTDLWIKDIVFTPNAANDTAIFTSTQTSGDTQVKCLTMTTYLQYVGWPNEGKQFRNLEITLTSASDVVCIYTRK